MGDYAVEFGWGTVPALGWKAGNRRKRGQAWNGDQALLDSKISTTADYGEHTECDSGTGCSGGALGRGGGWKVCTGW